MIHLCAGDYVYVRSDQDNPFIARIDKMWTDSKQVTFYSILTHLPNNYTNELVTIFRTFSIIASMIRNSNHM